MLEATWFMGRELSFAVSIDYGISNFAEFSNDLLEPIIYDYKGTVAHVLWAGFLLSAFSFVMSVFVYIFDGKRLAMEKESNRPQTGENFDMRDIFRFHWDLWVMSLATAFSTLIWILFNNIACEFFQMKFGFTLQTAGTLIGLEALATGLLIPFLGVLLDKYGNRMLLSKFYTNIGCISLGILFFLLIYMFLFASGLLEVTVLIILCGICNGTIYSCLWPTISYNLLAIID
jgi:nitrate/nitrite transporter NarK